MGGAVHAGLSQATTQELEAALLARRDGAHPMVAMGISTVDNLAAAQFGLSAF